MGKRNVTEWRDLIKRAIRRGELVKTVSELEYIEEEDKRDEQIVEDELSAALRRVAADNQIGKTEEVQLNEDYDDISALLTRMLGDSPTATVEEPIAEDMPADDAISFNLGEGLELESMADDTADDLDEPPFEVDETDDEWLEVEAEDETGDISDEASEVLPEPTADEIADAIEPTPEEPLEDDVTEEVVVTEEVKVREHSEEYERRLREEARREFAEREARLREEFERREMALREENERLGARARMEEERREEMSRQHREYVESTRQTEEELRRELEARDLREARERDRIAEAARQSIEEERRARMAEEAPAPEPIAAPEPVPVRELESSPAPASSEYMAKRVKIIFRTSVDYSVFGRIKDTIETTVISLDKADVPILMRASLEGDNIINLNITKMPKNEEQLLISIVKAIGNSRIGVTKIIIEDM